jgi:hypothetical protein
VSPTTLSPAIGAVLLEGCAEEDLAHLLACKRARHQIPDALAAELADEMVKMLERGSRPTVGWWKRRAERIEAARA